MSDTARTDTVKLTHPRYAAIALVGRGAQGAVLAVRDREAEHLPLVAKVWSSRAVDVAEARAEFALLSRVRSPALARAHDLAFDVATRAPFLVEERVDGPDLREAMADIRSRAARDPSGANDALASLLGQLLVSVGALHRAGFVHGDLKPVHVRLRAPPLGERDGRRAHGEQPGVPSPVLLDLGCALALTLDPSRSSEAAAHGFTRRFAAPELLRGDAKSVRTDLFALGASILACLDPSCASARELGAKDAAWIEPRVADVLQALVATRSRDRPADTDDALEQLGKAVARGARRATLATPRLEVARVLGRESALATLLGARGTLYVAGPAGVGKSHLLREAFVRATLAGRTARSYVFPDVPAPRVLELVQSLRQGALPAMLAHDEGDPFVVLDGLDRAPREVYAALDAYRCGARAGGRATLVAESREPPKGASCMHLEPLDPDAVEELASSLGLWGDRRRLAVDAARGIPAWMVAAAGGAPVGGDAVVAAARELPDDAKSALYAIAALGGSMLERALSLSAKGGQALRASGLVVRERVDEHVADPREARGGGETMLRLFAREVSREIADGLADVPRVEAAAALALGPMGASLPPSAKVSLAADVRLPRGTATRLLQDAWEASRRVGATETETAALLALGEAGDRTKAMLTRAERLLRDSGRASAYPLIASWLEEASARDPSLLPLARRRAAERAAREGRHDEARALGDEALALAKARGSVFDEGAALSTGGALALYRADIPEAAALLERAAALLDGCQDDDDEERARLEHNRGVVAMYQGRYDEARARLTSALGTKRRLGDRAGCRACLLNLGLAAHRLGALEEAESTLDEAIALAVSLDQAQGRGWCLAARAEVALTRQDPERARRAVAEARALGEVLPVPVRADLTLIEAEIALITGRYEEAEAGLRALDPELLQTDALVDARARALRASAALGLGKQREAARVALAAVRRARDAKIPHLEARAWGIFREARMTSPPRSLMPWLSAAARGASRSESVVSLLAAVVASTRAERAFLIETSAGGTDRPDVVGVDADGIALAEPERRVDAAELVRVPLPAGTPREARVARTALGNASSSSGLGSRVVVPFVRDDGSAVVLVVEHRYSAAHFDALADDALFAFAAAGALALRLGHEGTTATGQRVAPRVGHLTSEPRAPSTSTGRSTADADPSEETTYFPTLDPGDRFATIVGASFALQRAKARLDVAARSDLSVLLTGETGTGKEVFARALHDGSRRSRGPFVAIDCGAIHENLFEAELFGHARGAYTGADRARQGLLAQSDGGTLLLDEIGELAPGKQAVLLRALESRRYRPVGSDDERPFDVRVVAATNRDLRAEVERGAFRLDLLYRLDVLEIALPSLREREGDVRPLVEHFLHRAGRSLELSAEAWDALESYAWPGNVRELEHEIARLLALGVPRIGRSALGRRVRGGERAPTRGARRPGSPSAPSETVDARERLEVERALLAQDGNLTHAAKALGLTRQGLKKKMIRLGLRPRSAGGADGGETS